MRERWTYGLLLALLLGHLFLLSTHQKSRNNRLERWLLSSLGPIGHTVVGASAAVRELVASRRFAGALRRENAVLHREVESLRLRLTKLQGMKEQLESLARTVGYTPPETGEAVLADVVWIDRESWLRTMVIYSGTIEPKRNQPVVTDQGLVGRVIVPARRYAKILLLSDPSLVVSAMIVRTRQRGLLRGGDLPELENIPLLADVRSQDEVVTAGIDGIFPRGIPIGHVTKIEPGQGLFQRIYVESAIDFESLDQVHVLTREALPAEVRRELSTEDGE